MKKASVIIGLVAAVLVVYLVVQNNRIKQDLNHANAQAEKLNHAISKNDQQAMHFAASEPAASFIYGYFDFKEHPKEKDVAKLVTDKVAEKLDFGDISQSGGEDQIKSEVTELKIYYGDATGNRQKLFGVFTNQIMYNGQTSEKASYIRLDMLKSGVKWKVDDFSFQQ